MIQRIWHGYTTPENATAYEELLKEEVFKGIQLLRKNNADEVAFITIMTFENWEAVKQFAGEDYEQAYVPTEARKLLSRFDDKSMHYEVVLQLA